jgi:oxygen-independent coproporphyrinogen-3 oxidase
VADDAPKLGVYVHWPFCARICPYCDFNVYKHRGVDSARWTAALIRDLEHWAARTRGRRLTSLYFGGGTPSLMPVAVLEGVIEACDRIWGFAEAPEITLESNPTDAERDLFAAFNGAGINRLSLGVQSFDDEALAFLGRNHDGVSARRGVDLALNIFGNVTFDLIYALPGQSALGWREELAAALAIGAPHLSLYQLTIEPGTAFDKAVERGRWRPPDENLAADLFDIAQEMTAAAGLPAYEISNHARPGAESKHNLLYWRYADYVGVGPGAHGRLSLVGERIATETPLRPEDYLSLVETSGCGANLEVSLDAEAQLVEKTTMGLRLAEGVALSPADQTALGRRILQAEALAAEGYLRLDGRTLKATPDGRRLLNAVLSRLLS